MKLLSLIATLAASMLGLGPRPAPLLPGQKPEHNPCKYRGPDIARPLRRKRWRRAKALAAYSRWRNREPARRICSPGFA